MNNTIMNNTIMNNTIMNNTIMNNTIMNNTIMNSNEELTLAVETIIGLFRHYQISIPNLSSCWIEYLELKKRHCSKLDIEQSLYVLDAMASGYKDLKLEDLTRLLTYSASMAL
jgi:hypothetical protein